MGGVGLWGEEEFSNFLFFKSICSRAVVVHAFNPSTRELEAGRRISEFEASLVYKVSSRTARATQRNPVLKKPTKKTNKQTNKQKKQKQKQKPKARKIKKENVLTWKEIDFSKL